MSEAAEGAKKEVQVQVFLLNRLKELFEKEKTEKRDSVPKRKMEMIFHSTRVQTS